MISDAVDMAGKPATFAEICVLCLFSQTTHFVGTLPPVITDLHNEAWLHHLSPYPAWAIKAAIFWWMGPDNPKRASKAQPGDIAQRCKIEAGCITAGQSHLAYWKKYQGHYPSFLTKN